MTLSLLCPELTPTHSHYSPLSYTGLTYPMKVGYDQALFDFPWMNWVIEHEEQSRKQAWFLSASATLQ